jgi:hypothetical protein
MRVRTLENKRKNKLHTWMSYFHFYCSKRAGEGRYPIRAATPGMVAIHLDAKCAKVAKSSMALHGKALYSWKWYKEGWFLVYIALVCWFCFSG